jgi:hypothetical protein
VLLVILLVLVMELRVLLALVLLLLMVLVSLGEYNRTLHRLEAILEGDLDELSDALLRASQKQKNEPRPS